jgi:hypothetical protein
MTAELLDKELSAKISILNRGQKESILTLIKSFTSDNQKPLSKEQYNIEIKAAESRIKKGKFISQNEIEKQASKW